MRYESATQINRIKWHYFINGEFHSTQNMDMRLFFPQELDYILNGKDLTLFTNLEVLKKMHLMIIRINRYTF